MVRVNLLPVKRKKKPFQLTIHYVPGIILMVVAVFALIISYFSLNNKISAIKDDKVVKERRLAQIKEKIKEVESYERDNEAFRQKNKVIEDLKNKQSMPLRLLDEVSNMLPKGVWLTSLSDKGGSINIEGFAFTNPDLVNYIQNLKGSKFITDVALLESRQTKEQNISVYKFKLRFRMKV
jgi:type IV pilus assembly protein PilN